MEISGLKMSDDDESSGLAAWSGKHGRGTYVTSAQRAAADWLGGGFASSGSDDAWLNRKQVK